MKTIVMRILFALGLINRVAYYNGWEHWRI